MNKKQLKTLEEILKERDELIELVKEKDQTIRALNLDKEDLMKLTEKQEKELSNGKEELTAEQNEKLANYDALLLKYGKTDKKELENYIETLKNKPISPLTKEQQQKLKDYEKVVKERDNLKYFGKVAKSSSDNLVEQVNEHIIKAYNASQHLQGYYLSLMKRFLDWEYTGNEEQKEVCRKLKTNINQCVSFLEKFQGLEIKPFKPL